eukprot:scaffold285614_cov24-Tisochrysis_lutea.AAC.1
MPGTREVPAGGWWSAAAHEVEATVTKMTKMPGRGEEIAKQSADAHEAEATVTEMTQIPGGAMAFAKEGCCCKRAKGRGGKDAQRRKRTREEVCSLEWAGSLVY